MNKKIIFLSLFFLLTGFFGKVPKIEASTFANSYLRLDNQTANAPLSGTVCAQPSSAGAGTEAKINVAFPNGFSISTNTNNWTTNVSNLPDGATNWPGIGSTATSVSGRTVTFASGDLTANNLYCFNFTGSSSSTGASGPNQAGTFTSKNASNATIDQTTYFLAILDNNQIEVTGTVPPNTTYLPVSISSTPTGGNYPQNTILNYKINYGLLTIGAFPLVIQAQWNQGTIAGSPAPSANVVNYVIGSASDGYGGVTPVVDTVNQTITWTFDSFPGNTTNKSVTFQLETNDLYAGSSLVSFDVNARAISLSTVTPDQTVTQNYLYSATLAPTATPTPAPNNAPTPTAGPSTNSPTPTPAVNAAPSFSAVTIQALSQSQAQITIDTSSKSTFTVKYGTSPSSLSQNLTSLTSLASNTISLPDLLPDTNYYFKVVAKNADGQTINSDIFTFRTAVVSQAPTADVQTLVATSNNSVLTSPTTQSSTTLGPNSSPGIVVPVSSLFSIQFSLTKVTAIKSIQAFIISKNVLAANTFTASSANPNYVDLVEISPGVYTGKLLTQPDPGNYEIYTRIIDYNGNITIQKIAELNIVNKFTVVAKGTHTPVENARVLLYLYDAQLKTFSVISPSILSIINPAFSATDGTISTTLPQGKYRAEVSAIGYDSQTIQFDIIPQSGYPTIYLVPNASIITTVRYYLSTLSDALIASQIYFQQEAKSSRLFDLSTVGAVIFLIGITFLSIAARTHIAVFYIPYFLYFKLLVLFKKNTNRLLLGEVIDEKTGIPISRATVYLSPPHSNHILATLTTNRLGEFYYKNPKGLDYRITVVKEGFALQKPWEFVNGNVKAIPAIIMMEETEKPHHSILTIGFAYFEDFLGMFMEFLIIFGLLTQIYFVFTFGFLKVIPSICVTIINILLIITYLYKPRSLLS